VYVSSKQRSKVKVGPLKDVSGNIICDDKEAAYIYIFISPNWQHYDIQQKTENKFKTNREKKK